MKHYNNEILDIFVLCLYIYFNISYRLWLLDMEKYRMLQYSYLILQIKSKILQNWKIKNLIEAINLFLFIKYLTFNRLCSLESLLAILPHSILANSEFYSGPHNCTLSSLITGTKNIRPSTLLLPYVVSAKPELPLLQKKDGKKSLSRHPLPCLIFDFQRRQLMQITCNGKSSYVHIHSITLTDLWP